MCSYPDRAPRNSTVSKGHVPFVQQKQCKPHVHFFSSCIKSKKMNLKSVIYFIYLLCLKSNFSMQSL